MTAKLRGRRNNGEEGDGFENSPGPGYSPSGAIGPFLSLADQGLLTESGISERGWNQAAPRSHVSAQSLPCSLHLFAESPEKAQPRGWETTAAAAAAGVPASAPLVLPSSMPGQAPRSPGRLPEHRPALPRVLAGPPSLASQRRATGQPEAGSSAQGEAVPPSRNNRKEPETNTQA